MIACSDVTDRRQRDEALQRSEREAIDRARHLEAIIETIADGVLFCDRNGLLLQTNPAFRALLALDGRPDYSSLPLALPPPTDEG